jgi:lysophospholipid acyltransferase (LPLAT)-like uncharacterized protein
MTNQQDGFYLKNTLGGNGLYWLSQLTRRTCSYQISHLERLESVLKRQQPVIFTGWHGMTMMFVPMIQQHHPDLADFVVLMPDDWRGETLRIWTEKLGATPYPMNLYGDHTLGQARQVLKLVRSVKEGKSLYITPDGPDGPAHKIKPGILFIARKSGAVILPIGAYCRRAYSLHRWDRYTVPYPYSRIACHIGEPIETLPEDDITATRLITNTLNRITLQAAADYYEHGE